MAAVFISYKRENLAKVQPFVQALRGNGIDVWWDQDIAPDAPWEATIERELGAAKVAIVAWSQSAVASENVKVEARSARNAGKLIQVFVEKCDPPLFFGERQGVDLSDWTGDANDRRFRAVLAAVHAILEGKRPPEGVGYAPAKRTPWALLVALFAVLSAVFGFAANMAGARDFVCELAVAHSTCEQMGLITATADPEVVLAERRAALLHRAEGVWGNVAQDGLSACSATMRYSLVRRDGEDYINLTMPGYQSQGRVVSAESGSIFTRTVSPPSQAGTQWELRLEADRLIQVDERGRPTPLVRCGS
jgi:hypothetical protein